MNDTISQNNLNNTFSSHRFSRQTIIPQIGESRQKALSQSTALIVGCGALGSVQAELLCRAGVGKLILVDFDLVEESNLQRQALYTKEHVGKRKVDACEEVLKKIWPEVNIEKVPGYLSLQNISLLENCDVVLDGLDNMNTRFLLNEYCRKNNIPIVFASAVLDRGSVLVVDQKNTQAPCYNCIFENKHSDEDCGTTGVLNATTHLSATISSSEAIKLLLGMNTMQGLFSFSLFDNRYDVFSLNKNNACKVCQGVYEKLSNKDSFSLRFCNRVGGMRADPLNTKATKNMKELEGQKIIVDEFGAVFFPGLKDADVAKRLAEKLR